MRTTTPIPFAGSELAETRHVCAFFNSEDEKYRALLPFIKDGFACGHKAVHVVNPDQREDHLRRLAEIWHRMVGAIQSGQFAAPRQHRRISLPTAILIRRSAPMSSSDWRRKCRGTVIR